MRLLAQAASRRDISTTLDMTRRGLDMTRRGYARDDKEGARDDKGGVCSEWQGKVKKAVIFEKVFPFVDKLRVINC